MTATPEPGPFNDIDLHRSTPRVIELYKMALKLQFADDAHHWRSLLESRGVDMENI